MKNAEQNAKPASMPKIGRLVTLADLLPIRGIGVSSSQVSRATVLAVLAVGAFFALAPVPAVASTHIFSTSFGAATNPPPVPANPHPLTEPTAVAVDDSTGSSSGDTYVADPSKRWVEKFGPAGNLIWIVGKEVDKTAVEALLSTEAEQNLCTVASGDVCQSGAVSSAPGGFTGSFVFKGQSVAQLFLAVDGSSGPSAGDLYVADPGDDLITKLAPDGSLVESWGNNGTGGSANGQLAGNASETFGPLRGIAVDPSGKLVVLGIPIEFNPRIFEFVPDGSFIQGFPSGDISFVNPTAGIAVDSTDDVYIVREAGFVAKLDASGVELSETFAPAQATGGGIAIDPNDDVYVDDGIEVHRYDASGSELESFGSGHLTASQGLAVSPVNTIFVADTPAGHVTAFALFGPFVTVGPATGIVAAVAALHGRVGPTAAGEVSECRFEYVSAEAFAQSGYAAAKTVPCSPMPPYSNPTDVSAALIDLHTATTYDFRLAATDANATNFSREDTFTTLGPSIDSTSASTVSATAATLETEINPNGEATTYHFEYLTQQHFEALGFSEALSTPTGSTGSGNASVARATPLQDLAPSTTYRYRVLATSHCNLFEPTQVCTTEGPELTFTTQSTEPASLLPDTRAWELVSPLDKHGSPLKPLGESGPVIQAAADGSGLAYASVGPIVTGPAGNRSTNYSQVLATRSSAGWGSVDITTPNRVTVGLVVGSPSEYQLFSTDLSQAVVEPRGATPLSVQTTERTPYRREVDGSYTPLVTAANVAPGVEFGGVETVPGGLFAGSTSFITATPDLAHILLESPKALTSEFAPGFNPSYSSPRNIYEWSAGTLQLVSWIPSGSATVCGGAGPACVPASEAGQGSTVGDKSDSMRNAISTDGSRVVFAETRTSGNLYLRDLSSEETVQLEVAQPGATGKSGGGRFEFASSDGFRVFFTDANRLTAHSIAANNKSDLYMCQIEVTEGHLGCVLSDLTVNTVNPAEPAAVRGTVLGGSTDGSSVFFVADGVLTTAANPAGESPVAGQPNLYAYDVEAHAIHLVAVLSTKDAQDWTAEGGQDLGYLTARVSPDGHWVAFMSERPLTGYDNRDAVSGERDEEVFLYDVAANNGGGRVVCASCDPTGARPRGVMGAENPPGLLVDGPRTWSNQWFAANIPGWTQVDLGHALYQSRYLSDSGRLFFDSADALVSQDSNGTQDVYQYEPAQVGGCTEASVTYGRASGGCVDLVSSGTSREESTFLDASESGDDVFFLTASRLAPQDVDSAFDIYDARAPHVVGEPVGFPEGLKPVECFGDACQQPAVPPNDLTPGSFTFNGAGNLPSAVPSVVVRSKSSTRARLLARALRVCRTKHSKHKRRVCEQQARKRLAKTLRSR